MTQTTPSHSQAVEAAERRLSSVLARSQKGTAFWSEITEAINDFKSAIASQQEVAAPGEPTPEMIAAFKAAFKEGSIWEDRITAGLRAALAASRVPVASLASREQVNLAACGVGGVQVPADVLKAAASFQENDYRGPLAWARKVFDWVVEQGAAPKAQEGGK